MTAAAAGWEPSSISRLIQEKRSSTHNEPWRVAPSQHSLSQDGREVHLCPPHHMSPLDMQCPFYLLQEEWPW